IYGRALIYGNKGDLDHAIQDFTELIRLKPDLPDAFANRGWLYERRRDYIQAILDLTEALRMKPDLELALVNRGAAYENSGDSTRAINDLSAAIHLQPSDSLAFYDRGVAWYKKHRRDLAMQDYNQAIRLKPDFPEALNNRGIIYAATGNYARAIKDFSEALRLRPGYVLALGNRSQSYRRTGNLAAASRDLKEAMRLSPRDAFAFKSRRGLKGLDSFDLATTNLAGIASPRRDLPTTSAVPIIENSYIPRIDPVRVDTAKLLRDRDAGSTLNVPPTTNIPEPTDSKRDSIPDPSVETEGVGGKKMNLAITFGNQVNRGPSSDSFIESWTQLIRLDPKNADAFFERGLLYRRKGDLNHAIQDFTEALRLRPNFAAAQRNMDETKKEKASGK
ncbi:MAG TPA: tetratricopeptide repeat protein, partial [Candidatus Angelobacter sp.]|nr:tetratricopeptide repeat protein [Candidatus Angelobacter sp.]